MGKIEKPVTLSQLEPIEFVATCDIRAYKAPQGKVMNWLWRKARRVAVIGLCGMIWSAEAMVTGLVLNNSACGLSGFIAGGVLTIFTMNFWLGEKEWAPTDEQLVASLGDSAWHYLKENAKNVAELGARVRSFNDRLMAFKNAVLPLGDPVPEEYSAATEQLARERLQLVSETDSVLEELGQLVVVDSDRLRCLQESHRLRELEAVFAKHDNPQYRDTRDTTPLTAAITLRESVEGRAEQLGLPPQWIPPRKKLVTSS